MLRRLRHTGPLPRGGSYCSTFNGRLVSSISLSKVVFLSKRRYVVCEGGCYRSSISAEDDSSTRKKLFPLAHRCASLRISIREKKRESPAYSVCAGYGSRCWLNTLHVVMLYCKGFLCPSAVSHAYRTPREIYEKWETVIDDDGGVVGETCAEETHTM